MDDQKGGDKVGLLLAHQLTEIIVETADSRKV